ncbi:MAG: HAD-IA family hydrolase [Aerococcaceae bacterium]|nr:HAD-IA family hydrolase [Aerococcaceae bacterium]
MYNLDLNKKKQIIFDFDGLLVNSEDVIGESWLKTCDYFSIDYPEGFFDDIVGVSKKVTFEALKAHMENPIDVETFFDRRARFIEEAVEEGLVKLLPGVQAFLEKMHEKGVPMYIATSSSKLWPAKITEQLNIRHFFESIYGEEDDQSVKPSPDLYLKVLNEHQLSREHTVIFEDSFSGIMAATSAQVDTIVVNKIPYQFEKNNEMYILCQVPSFNEIETDPK